MRSVTIHLQAEAFSLSYISQRCACLQVQSKDLDTWWSGMESNLADILSGDDLCNYFDFIGNFDDRDLFLFVKTAEHLCTLNYHCRLPTDTATHNVTYASAAKLLSRTGDPSPLSMQLNFLVKFGWMLVVASLLDSQHWLCCCHLQDSQSQHLLCCCCCSGNNNTSHGHFQGELSYAKVGHNSPYKNMHVHTKVCMQ